MQSPSFNSSYLAKHRLQAKVMATIAAILSPVYLVMTSTASMAQTTIVSSSPDGKLQTIQGNRPNTLRWIWKNPSQIQDPKQRQRSIAISSVSLSSPNQRLLIPGAGNASLQVKNLSSPAKFRMTINGSAEYWYFCNSTTGNFTLAWLQGKTSNSPCKIFQVHTREAMHAQKVVPVITALQPFADPSKIKQIDRDTSSQVFGKTFYCSAASGASSVWGFHASDNSWDLLSPTDSCAQAVAECQQAAGGSCEVVNLGERSINDNNLTASLQCDRIAPGDPRFTLRGLRGDELIPQLTALNSRAKTAGAGSCLINVTAPDELNLSPSGGLLDSANVYEVGGNLVVIGLTGSVLVTSTQLPQGVRVTAGDVYVYDPRQPSLATGTENRYGRCPADAYRFLPLSGYRPVSLSPGDSNLYKGKQLEDRVPSPANQQVVTPSILAQTFSLPPSGGSSGPNGSTSPTPRLPWGLIPGIIRILTPRPADSPQSSETPPPKESGQPPRPFTPSSGGALCSLPPDSALRQQIVMTSPSISGFLAETNWGEPAFDSAYRTAIAQQFLNVSAGITQGGR